MEDLIHNRLYFKKSQDFIRFIIRALFGIEPRHIYVHEFLSTCFGCLSFTHLINSLLHGEYVPVSGWENVIQRIINQLPESFHIIREECITEIINVDARTIYVETHLCNMYRAKVVVIACPWETVRHIKFTPPIMPHLMNRVKKCESYVIVFVLKYNISAWRRIGD